MTMPAESSTDSAARAYASAARLSPAMRMRCSTARICSKAFSCCIEPEGSEAASKAASRPLATARGSLGDVRRGVGDWQDHAAEATNKAAIIFVVVMMERICYRVSISSALRFTFSMSHRGVDVAPHMPMLSAPSSHSGMMWFSFDTR